MGLYTLVIEGHGQNQNGVPGDADELLAEFVRMMNVAGQKEVRAAFIYGVKAVDETADRAAAHGATVVKRFE